MYSNDCSLLNRKCSLKKICNEKLFKIVENLNILELESYLIEYVLWLRKIIKLEERLDFYTDDCIEKILKKFWLNWKIIYWKIFIWEDKFIIFAENKKELNEFLFYDFSNNPNLRAFETWTRLWYPKCCVKKYIWYFEINPDNSYIDDIIDNNNDKKISSDVILFEKVKNCPLLFKRYYLLSHHYCTPDCKESIIKAEKKLKYILNNIKNFR